MQPRSLISAVLAAVLILAAAGACAETPSFSSAYTLPVGGNPNALVSFDFNRDGVPDIAAVNTRDGTVSVLLGNGDGTFKPRSIYAVGTAPTAIAAGDLNGDGVLDLMVVNSGSYDISILIGKGDGTFKSAIGASVAPHPPVGIAFGDFDGNGSIDLAVVSSNQTVSILRGVGNGQFGTAVDIQVNLSLPLGITQIVAAHLNTDAIMDLVTLNQSQNTVSVLLGNGDGTFQVGATYGVYGTLPDILLAVDLNHDGRIDLVSGAIAGGLTVLLGNGDGTFGQPVNYPVAGSVGGLAASDVSGDAIPDLVVASSDFVANVGSLTVFIGNGDGSFQPARVYPLAFSQIGIVVADFNRDGHADVAVALNRSENVSVLLSNVVTPQAGVWWNPAEGGRGYTIEKSGDNLFMAAYLYDASGRSTWYGAGPSAMSGPTFSAPLADYAGGQTLTGSYKSPVQTSSPGNLSITFSDATHGSLTWPGGSIPIQKYEYVQGGLSLPNSALDPQTGWWWNPAEGGRGFSIEMQGGNAYIATYMYDAAGNPVWYSSGPAPLAAGTFQGTWTAYAGGQTLTGAYQPPKSTSNAGSVTIQFTSTTTGTLTLPDGRQISIRRFGF